MNPPTASEIVAPVWISKSSKRDCSQGSGEQDKERQNTAIRERECKGRKGKKRREKKIQKQNAEREA